MDEKLIQERIRQGRAFISGFGDDTGLEDYQSDQDLKKPQPPLTKAPMTDQALELPNDFEKLSIDGDFLHIINTRRSRRNYTEAPMSLLQLSYLLWCSQGVKSVRGRAYATLRTVPSGGARHPFETYLAIQNVTGLQDGLYHYLPMKHRLEFLGCPEDLRGLISRSLCEQDWAVKANVVFFYSCVFYRGEWRYGIWAHGPMLMDSGHVTENLYLAATSIGLGGCAIAAVDPEAANPAFSLDGKEECIFYAMPVGTVPEDPLGEEETFYAFVREQNL